MSLCKLLLQPSPHTSRFVYYDSEYLVGLGMARLKVTARPIGSEDIEPSEEERRQLSEGEEDLTNVDADPS